MNKWLDSIATDLQTLEADAAPPGWKCIWNRYATVVLYTNTEGRFGKTRMRMCSYVYLRVKMISMRDSEDG